MTQQKSGLIVNISSAGGLRYLFNVPYGVGKAALDRLTQDTAVELKRHNVAVIGVWPGPVKTETINSEILGNLLSCILSLLAASSKLLSLIARKVFQRFSHWLLQPIKS